MPDDLSCELCGEPIVLDRDRSLKLRHSAEADGAALAALYRRLSPQDLYLRFFTAGIPPQRWFDQWASIGDRGGCGLLVVETVRGESTVVAEAGYSLLCNGDGELGIAVDPKARGWLGPWLLDALLRHADARGVPNIQALVLSGNHSMVALAKSRGTATASTADWSTIRLSMSSKGHVPSWPGDRAGDTPHERPRLLVESDRSRWSGAPEAIRLGFDVLACHGPAHQKHGCPLLTGEPCPLLEGADAVVHILDPTKPANLELLTAQHIAHPGLRVIEGYESTEDGEWQRRRDADLVKELQDGKDDE